LPESTESPRAAVAELRRRYRRFRWSSQRGLLGRLTLAARIALRPLIAAAVSTSLVSRHGGTVARRHGASRLAQLTHMWWLRVRHGLEPEWYYHYRLFLPEKWERADLYLRMSEVRELLILLRASAPDPSGSLFGDKRNFEAWCARHGFPAIPTLMVVDGRGSTGAWSPPRNNLFSKPANWQGGMGARRWCFDGAGYVGSDGVRRDDRNLLAELEAQSVALARPILVQPCLTNHVDLAPLTSGGLCTVRLVTTRSLDGVVAPFQALYKMIVNDSAADNMHAGNIAAPVDLATGTLGTAAQTTVGSLGDRLARHPATGAAIEGTTLPYWPEVVALGLRAHAAVDRVMPFVGWDIAITDEGPVLVEGNARPGAAMQRISQTPLGETRFATLLLEYLRTYAR
jgi:hypothetical protein